MGRTHPTECPHGVTVDWGDFGPDPHDGSVGAQECDQCRAEREAWADALMDRLTRQSVALQSAEGCCMNDAWRGHACQYHEGFYDGCDAMWRALQDGEGGR
jgi:hypothetical protein